MFRTLYLLAVSLALAPTVFGQLRLSEFVANPDGRTGSIGIQETGLPNLDLPPFSDWIEVENVSASPVDLSAYRLTDDKSPQGTAWTFPAITLAPGAFFVVLADGADAVGDYPHTNFNIAVGGEYLGILNSTGAIVDELLDFPTQIPSHSYARNSAGQFVYHETPTPGSLNAGPTAISRVSKPTFGTPGGFHSTALSVSIAGHITGEVIHYTLDGRIPTEADPIYQAPIPISADTQVVGIRARAFFPGWIPSDVAARSFLINQPPALTSLPVMLFQGEQDEVFFPPNGILKSQDAKERDDEREASMEYYTPDGVAHDQLNVGLRLAGNPSNLHEFLPSGNWKRLRKRPQFNMFFRSEYGSSSWNTNALIPESPVSKFDSIRLRTSDNAEHPIWIDEFVRRSFVKTGQPGSLGNFINVFINGKFMTVYNPVERPRTEWFQQRFDNESLWDVLHVYEFTDGDDVFYREMVDFFRFNDFTVQANYETASSTYLEPGAFIDYMLVHTYLGTNDWPFNNKIAARERPSGRFQYFPWDAEKSMNTGRGLWPEHRPFDYDVFGNFLIVDDPQQWAESRPYHIPLLFSRFLENPEFRLLWADRVQQHLFQDGALSDAGLNETWFGLSQSLAPIVSHHFEFTYDDAVFTGWRDARRPEMFAHLSQHGLWPSTTAPEISPHGGTLSSGTAVSLTHTNTAGTLYFTTDGSDPRLLGGSVSPTAQISDGTAFPIQASATYRARVFTGTDWSPLVEASFTVLPLIRISELMYHPSEPSPAEQAAGHLDKNDFEYVELVNTGSTTIDLTKVRLTDGIFFDFSEGSITSLEPGHRVLVVADVSAFEARYGTALPVTGAYSGKLKNSGESITLSLASGDIIQAFTFSDTWYPATDGLGESLEIIDLGAPLSSWDEATGWRSSNTADGTPGQDHSYASWALNYPNASSIQTQPEGDQDQDGISNLFEYAARTDPADPASGEPIGDGQGDFQLSYQRPVQGQQISSSVYTAGDLEFILETTSTISIPSSWSDSPASWELASQEDNGDGTETVSFQLVQSVADSNVRLFCRLRLVLQ